MKTTFQQAKDAQDYLVLDLAKLHFNPAAIRLRKAAIALGKDVEGWFVNVLLEHEIKDKKMAKLPKEHKGVRIVYSNYSAPRATL